MPDKLLHIADLRGSAFADTLAGDFSGNRLEGAGGDDVLSGGGGADTLTGGAGLDLLYGGSGADVFVLLPNWGADVIMDWEDGTDRIDVRQLGIGSIGSLTISATGSTANIAFEGNVLRIANATGLISGADIIL